MPTRLVDSVETQRMGTAAARFATATLTPPMSGVSESVAGSSLTRKASLNVVAAALDLAARMIVGLLLQPLLVGGLGDTFYGAWKLLSRMTGYVSAASGRPTQALKWTIANHQASSDFDEKRRRVATAIVIWVIFLPVLSTVGGVVAWFAPRLMHASEAIEWTVRVAALILIGRIILSSLVEIPEAVLRGENLGYKRMGLSSMLVFAGGGLTGVALFFETGLIGVAVAQLATTLMTGALFYAVVRSHIPWFGLARPSRAAIRWFFGISGWLLVWRFVSRLMMSSDIIVLGVFGSLELVTAYSLTKHVPEMLISSISSMIGAVIPGLGGILGSANYEKGTKLRGEFMLLTWLSFVTLGATALLWNQDFVGLWVGPQYAGDALTTLLIMVMVYQFVVIRTDGQIIDLTLDVRMKTILAAACAGISLLLSSVLVTYFEAGIPGLCAGFIIGRLILCVAYAVIVGRVLGVSLASQFSATVRPAIATLIVFASVWIANDSFDAGSWLELTVAAATTFGVVSMTIVFLGLSHAQRNLLSRRIKKVLQPILLPGGTL